MSHHTYEIINQSDVAGLDFSQLRWTESTIRLNSDSTEAVVSYEDTRPATLSGITALTKDNRTEHTHAQILILMAAPVSSGVVGWYQPEE